MFKKILLFSIIFQSFLFGLSDNNYRYSLGVFNERLGFNLFNGSYIFNEKNNSEFFASFGTSIMISGIGVGWKHYYNSKFYTMSPFSCISIFQRYGNKMAETSGGAIRTDNCIAVSGGLRSPEFELFNRVMCLQLGIFSNIDFRNDIPVLPFINIEFKHK
jgi:hypothetical protein|tara:strand:+ start:134 stop:613 length:480 start_codon:yes stop_codon:yes gene_type:complete